MNINFHEPCHFMFLNCLWRAHDPFTGTPFLTTHFLFSMVLLSTSRSCRTTCVFVCVCIWLCIYIYICVCMCVCVCASVRLSGCLCGSGDLRYQAEWCFQSVAALLPGHWLKSHPNVEASSSIILLHYIWRLL